MGWLFFKRFLQTSVVLLPLLISCGKTGLLTVNTICESNLSDLSFAVTDRYTGARNWTYYVQSADTSQACAVGGSVACTHAGEGREVVLQGISSCDGLSATDSEGAFNWFCREESGNAIFAIAGFAADKGLADLIDMSTEQFRDMSVTVADSCGSSTTASSKWWTNPIAALPANPASGNALILIDGTDDDGGGPDEAYAAGTILYLDSDRETGGYSFGMDNVALTTGDATLTYNGFFNPNVNANGAPGMSRRAIMGAQNADFLWIEGIFNGEASTSADHQLLVATSEYLRLHNVTMQVAAREPVFLRSGNVYALFTNIKISGATRNCIRITNGSEYFTIIGGEIFNCGIDGIGIDASNFTFSNLQISNTVGEAIAGISNVYQNMVLSQVLVSNAGTTGIYAATTPTFIQHSTVVSSASRGIQFPNLTSNHSVHNILLQNNNLGLLNAATNVNFIDITSVRNQTTGIQIAGTANNGTFLGSLMVGNNGTNCDIGGAVNPGLSNAPSDCSTQGTSTHTTTLGVDSISTFVGQVTSDGTNTLVPSVDTSAADVSEPFDFDFEYITWGTSVSTDHYDNANVGAATIGADTVFAWDWGLSSSDAGNGGSALALGVNPCPSGSSTHTHNLSGIGLVTFALYAVELMQDGIGNDNTFCESNEACLYAPNRGAYQGHGDLLKSSAVSGCQDIGSGGTVENITLYEYDFNGR